MLWPLMKIALAQFNPTVGDFGGNSARILELAGEAKSRGADIAVFSELCLCGYPPQDLVERPAFAARNQKELVLLAKAIPMPSLVGFVGKAQDDTGKGVANSAALIASGKILFEQRKMLLVSSPKRWASRSARIAGTTRRTGRSAFTTGIRWRSWWGREARCC